MSTLLEFPKFWVLNGHTPKPATLQEWAAWFEDDKHRVVALTILGDDRVSTVFVGIDHSMGGPVPLLFETMVFVDGHSEWDARCSTWDQAQKQHKIGVLRLLHIRDNVEDDIGVLNAPAATAKDH